MLVSVVGVLAAGALALAPAANAAAGCRVAYTVHGERPGGFTAGVQITNLGDAVDGWTLRFRFPADQQITNGWSAAWSQSGPEVTAGHAGWNAALATGASAYLGFNGATTGVNPVPTAFTFNGAPCTGSLPTATPTPIGTPPATVTPPVTPPGSSSSTGPFDPCRWSR
jgi:endoglucanase